LKNASAGQVDEPEDAVLGGGQGARVVPRNRQGGDRCFQAGHVEARLTGGEIPEPERAVVARRKGAPGVGERNDKADAVAMSVEGAHLTARLEVPHPQREIVAGRDEKISGRQQSGTTDRAQMARQPAKERTPGSSEALGQRLEARRCDFGVRIDAMQEALDVGKLLVEQAGLELGGELVRRGSQHGRREGKRIPDQSGGRISVGESVVPEEAGKPDSG
jgi:hypothetical protein